ncbi:hypothetical protein DYE49_11945 [Treponema rectale]|uniref:Uncharacterized protein n=1 Tax=Treponema rectale TaxID=744512 RepID=A0A840SFN3_9SPIR|nr:hypothetical protein [Treponema rectale]MBB5218968.1 hypothetical protein [Treponema rectale]QOS41120.1 hypothetical protein DYE49_11945 [Treponema rectale]
MKNIVWAVILFISLITLIILCIKAIKLNIVERNKLIKHLEEKGDYKSLYDLGFYNKYYQKESRRGVDTFVVAMEKYNETKDVYFLNYADFIDGRIKIYLVFQLSIMINLIVFIKRIKILCV